MSQASRLAKIYNGMKQRCYNTNCTNYKNYGARGVTVCKEWLCSERVNISGHNNPSKGFLAFMLWAKSNGYADNLSLDRIDNNKGYSSDNCRWVTTKVQNNNRRNNLLITYKNTTKPLSIWCTDLHLDYQKTFQRLYRLHWSVEDAFESV